MTQEIGIIIYVEIPVSVTIDVSPGSPGKLYGPPENCYPPEPPEADLTGFDKDLLLKDIQEHLDNIPEDELLEYCQEEAESRRDYAAERDAEDIKINKMMGRN